MRRLLRGCAAALLLPLLGCSSLLPYQRNYAVSDWESYEEVLADFERAAVGTPRSDLAPLELEPYSSPNVDLLTYFDVFRIFVPHRGALLADQPEGVRRCVAVRERCTGIVVTTGREEGRGYGSFWLDFLRIRQRTEVRAWYFEGLLVLVDDIVAYQLHAGEPRISLDQDLVRPLGPFQDIDAHVQIKVP